MTNHAVEFLTSFSWPVELEELDISDMGSQGGLRGVGCGEVACSTQGLVGLSGLERCALVRLFGALI
jgi:hypothetical protein